MDLVVLEVAKVHAVPVKTRGTIHLEEKTKYLNHAVPPPQNPESEKEETKKIKIAMVVVAETGVVPREEPVETWFNRNNIVQVQEQKELDPPTTVVNGRDRQPRPRSRCPMVRARC